MIGKVLWFDNNKGYGFIKAEEIDRDIFFHWTQINTDEEFKEVLNGQKVSFELLERESGRYEATNVEPLRCVNEETGRPLLLVGLLNYSYENTIQEIQIAISNLQRKGAQYIKFAQDYIIATSEPIDDDECDKILYFLLNSDSKDNIIDTIGELNYDIMKI